LLACGCTTYTTVANGDFLLSTTQLGYFKSRLDGQERHAVIEALTRNGASCATRADGQVRCAYAYCVDARPRILTWAVGRSVSTWTVRPPKLDEMASSCGPNHLYAMQRAYIARNGATLVSLN